MIRVAVVLAAFALLAAARPADAHPMDVGYLKVDVDGREAAVELDIDVNLAALLVGADPQAVDAAWVQQRGTQLADATYRASPLGVGQERCAWTAPDAHLAGRTVTLSDRARCGAAIRTFHWDVGFVARAPTTFKLLVKVDAGGAQQASIVDRDHPAIDASGDTSVGFGDFVLTGIAHIGAMPSEWKAPDGGVKLPDGIDHILFVLALLLAGGTIRQIAGIATGFTVGHTITLAIATLGVYHPPAALIEPLIALSIAVVAAEALQGPQPPSAPRAAWRPRRWHVATFFGLIHGFGFARALQDFDLARVNRVEALFGYNLGVELGQLTIILIVFPLLLLMRRWRYTALIVRPIAPALILVAGLWWFVQRAFISPPA